MHVETLFCECLGKMKNESPNVLKIPFWHHAHYLSPTSLIFVLSIEAFLAPAEIHNSAFSLFLDVSCISYVFDLMYFQYAFNYILCIFKRFCETCSNFQVGKAMFMCDIELESGTKVTEVKSEGLKYFWLANKKQKVTGKKYFNKQPSGSTRKML